jgi:hypothetical protein
MLCMFLQKQFHGNFSITDFYITNIPIEQRLTKSPTGRANPLSGP